VDNDALGAESRGSIRRYECACYPQYGLQRRVQGLSRYTLSFALAEGKPILVVARTKSPLYVGASVPRPLDLSDFLLSLRIECRLMAKQPSPNDQRSNALNPNNAAFKAAEDNRANQMNPNNPASKASPGK